jgi:hypothetical protein
MESGEVRDIADRTMSDNPSKLKKDAPGDEVESIRIERAENGYIADVCMKPKPHKANECMSWEPPKRRLFTDVAEIGAYVKEMFGDKA